MAALFTPLDASTKEGRMASLLAVRAQRVIRGLSRVDLDELLTTKLTDARRQQLFWVAYAYFSAITAPHETVAPPLTLFINTCLNTRGAVYAKAQATARRNLKKMLPATARVSAYREAKEKEELDNYPDYSWLDLEVKALDEYCPISSSWFERTLGTAPIREILSLLLEKERTYAELEFRQLAMVGQDGKSPFAQHFVHGENWCGEWVENGSCQCEAPHVDVDAKSDVTKRRDPHQLALFAEVFVATNQNIDRLEMMFDVERAKKKLRNSVLSLDVVSLMSDVWNKVRLL